jgi:hypothetical protein
MKWNGFLVLSVVAAGLVFPALGWAAADPVKESALSQVDRRIVGMDGTVKKLYREVAKAREENEIHRVNCLQAKLNLVKGLLKAADRAKAVLLEAFYGKDTETAAIYKGKVDSYADSSAEIEKSISECRGVKTAGEGTTLVYIRPEGAEEVEPSESGGWTWGFTPGSEGYPAVPPASPFR